MDHEYDVEALLDSVAKDMADSQRAAKAAINGEPTGREHQSNGRPREREHERAERGSREREVERKGRGRDSEDSRNRRRSRSSDRHGGRHSRDDYSRGVVPSERHYRPAGRDHRDRRDDRHYDDGRDDRRDDRRDRDRYHDAPRSRNPESGKPARRRSRSPPVKGRTPTPPLTEDERDRRTVFVQQLAARLRTKDLIAFFETVGTVKEAQIVKDRVSGRSKGVGYVEFKEEASVQAAIDLTGQKLMGIPIIAQLTEAEKNRQARTTEGSGHGNSSSVPFHRLYVGNIHFSITETDLENIFEPFGELEFVQLQKEDQGRSKGYGFVQFVDPTQAREALEKMNGFELAGRPIRVGLGNDKFTPESTANLLQRFQGQSHNFQGSAFSGHGGRGAQAGGAGGSFDRSSGREKDRGAGGASALDDTDVGGVNFNNYSRDSLMRKLARTEEPAEKNGDSARKAALKAQQKKPAVEASMASRCIVLRNAFNPAEETGENWVNELEEDVRAECEDKYGHVVHIAVDPNTQGDIYVKFDRIQGGENAIKGLNGRYFGGRMISAQPMVDAVYGSLFSKAKDL